MHFPIIELDSVKTARKDWISAEDLYDSPTVQYFTDYVGDEYAAKERRWCIKSDYMKEFFAGIAEVDVENQCVHFLSEDEIRKTLLPSPPGRLFLQRLQLALRCRQQCDDFDGVHRGRTLLRR